MMHREGLKDYPLIAKLFNLNFHPLEVVDRVSETQLQVSENYSDLRKMEVNCFQILLIDVTSLTCLKVLLNVLIKIENPNICGTGG